MSTPTAESLFLQAWCTATNSDDAEVAPPGTPEFRERRRQVFEHWAKVWHDCVDLAAHLAQVTTLKTQLAEAFEAMRAAEIEDEAEPTQAPLVHLTTRALQVLARQPGRDGEGCRIACSGELWDFSGRDFTAEDAIRFRQGTATKWPTCPACLDLIPTRPCPSCDTHARPIHQAHSFACSLFNIDGKPRAP